MAFKAIYLLHVALLVLAAIAFFPFFGGARAFGCQKYILMLAGIGFVVMLCGLSMAPADAPVKKPVGIYFEISVFAGAPRNSLFLFYFPRRAASSVQSFRCDPGTVSFMRRPGADATTHHCRRTGIDDSISRTGMFALRSDTR